MTYIRHISEDQIEIGGMVATEQMIADGWFEYSGEIPPGEHFKLVDGVVVAFTPEKTDNQKYHEALDYLNATDHKTYADYEAKPGEDVTAILERRQEARREVRAYLEKYNLPSP